MVRVVENISMAGRMCRCNEYVELNNELAQELGRLRQDFKQALDIKDMYMQEAMQHKIELVQCRTKLSDCKKKVKELEAKERLYNKMKLTLEGLMKNLTTNSGNSTHSIRDSIREMDRMTSSTFPLPQIHTQIEEESEQSENGESSERETETNTNATSSVNSGSEDGVEQEGEEYDEEDYEEIEEENDENTLVEGDVRAQEEQALGGESPELLHHLEPLAEEDEDEEEDEIEIEYEEESAKSEEKREKSFNSMFEGHDSLDPPDVTSVPPLLGPERVLHTPSVWNCLDSLAAPSNEEVELLPEESPIDLPSSPIHPIGRNQLLNNVNRADMFQSTPVHGANSNRTPTTRISTITSVVTTPPENQENQLASNQSHPMKPINTNSSSQTSKGQLFPPEKGDSEATRKSTPIVVNPHHQQQQPANKPSKVRQQSSRTTRSRATTKTEQARKKTKQSPQLQPQKEPESQPNSPKIARQKAPKRDAAPEPANESAGRYNLRKRSKI